VATTVQLPRAPRRRRRFVGPVLVVGGLVVLVVGVIALLVALKPTRDTSADIPRFDYPTLDVAAGAGVPYATAVTAPDWVTRLAGATDIPERTLRAYVQAAATITQRTPGCHLTWSTLAGVGRVESHHGRMGGSTVGQDGVLTVPIIGVALDGSPGVKAIKDTDGGRLDGDTQWDRAVGFMQFLPSTWVKYAARASGDGRPADPQNVDDSALTAGRYLCATGGNLGTGPGWWKGVLTYNNSYEYGRDVFSAADAYAREAARV
jgi:membrane-bound lytic murein transglycosylase B